MAILTTQQLKQALDISKQIEMLDKKKSDLQAKLDRMLAGGSSQQKPGRPQKKAARKTATKKNVKAKPVAKRTKKGQTSKQTIADVLKAAGKPIGINEIMDALTAKGIKSTAKDPKNALRVMLYGDKNTFQQTGQGKFTVR